MPAFSPDGTRLVFNDFALDTARGLAVMDFDVKRNFASNYRILSQEAAGGETRPGWPFFLPDNKAVVFVRTDAESFSSETVATGATLTGNVPIDAGVANPNDGLTSTAGRRSDLYIADVATGKTTLLARAMGFHTPGHAERGETYLPFVENDLHHNYFPTVSPVAAGGYFWVFFDTMRNFGSLGLQRAVWGFAIDIRSNGDYTTDPSHPPFYLPGQEFATSSNNHRAFATLDRCRPLGEPCETGIDCCDGRCRAGTCAPQPPADRPSCAKRDERCASDADCCPPATATEPPNICINNFCAFVPLL